MPLSTIALKYCPAFLQPAMKRVLISNVRGRIASGLFWSIAGGVASKGLLLLSSILVARILGTTGYGELGMIQATVGMVGLFAGFGMGLTATKYVAEYRKDNPAKAGRVIALSSLFSALTGGLLAGGFILFAPWLSVNMLNAPHLADVLQIGGVLVFLSVLNGAQNGALSGFEAFRIIAIVNVIVGLLSFPILVGGVVIGGLRGAVWAHVTILSLTWIMTHLALRNEVRRYSVHFNFHRCTEELPVLWNYSLPIVMSGMISVPALWLSRTMLANQPDGYVQLGLVAVAESWRFIPLFLCAMIAQVNLPLMAELYGQRQIDSLKKVFQGQLLVTSAIAIIGALIVILGSDIILAAYGPAYTDAGPALITFALSTIPMQITAVVGTFNRSIGKVWWNVFLNTLWATVLLVAAIFWVTQGARGFANALLLSYSVQFIAAIIYFWFLIRHHSDFSVGKSIDSAHHNQ